MELSQEQPLTAEQLYKNTVDSVNLLERVTSKKEHTEEELDTIDRNKRHIEIMLSGNQLNDCDFTVFIPFLS
jgi:hypothetical protein